MNERTSIASSNRNAPSATWTALLECVESAQLGVLDLDGGAPEVLALAERLVDLGFLRVPRAGCYSLTPAGRQLLKWPMIDSTPTKSRRSVLLFLPVSLAALAIVVLWVWLKA